MRKLILSTFVTLDGVMQDPGGFGEIERGGWANDYFNDEATAFALEALASCDYFLFGNTTFELFKEFWSKIKVGEYAQIMNSMPKLVATNKASGALGWNGRAISGDVM